MMAALLTIGGFGTREVTMPGCQESVYRPFRFYKWHVLATEKDDDPAEEEEEERRGGEMYCFPRFKDLPTPNFVFRLENETANCEGRKRREETEGETKQIS